MGKFHDLMDRELRVRGLAESTREHYLGYMRCFVRHFMLPPDELTLEHIKQYQLHLTTERGVCYDTFNGHVCAIRFFYDHVLEVDWEVKRIPYQKTGRKLPVVLSREEVLALFGAVVNLKHRTILMALYSAGLRISEALHLKAADIDSGRMTIRLEQSKGRKDRYVMLSEKLLEILRRYWKECRPDAWLFPGRDPSHSLSRDAVEQAFARARERAGIAKKATPHTLRHSFATHLFERGVNIRVIQRLLGHKSIRTTEVYTHVAGNYLRDTKSLLDDLLPDVDAGESSAVA